MKTRQLLIALLLAGACQTSRIYADPAEPRYAGSAARSHSDPSVRGDTLVFVSFNIEFARHVDSAIAVLRSDSVLRRADVLLLQEMDDKGTRQIAEAFDLWWVYYPAISHGRTRRDFGNAVLSRWPIVSDAKIILPHQSRYAGTPRIATAATIRIGRDSLRVYSTHLGTPLDVSGAARRRQLAAIVADAEPYGRVVIAGDMNESDVGDVARKAGYEWPTERGPRTTIFGRWDHIYMKGLALPDSLGTGTILDVRGSSDHKPIWAAGILP